MVEDVLAQGALAVPAGEGLQVAVEEASRTVPLTMEDAGRDEDRRPVAHDEAVIVGVGLFTMRTDESESGEPVALLPSNGRSTMDVREGNRLPPLCVPRERPAGRRGRMVARAGTGRGRNRFVRRAARDHMRGSRRLAHFKMRG